MRLQDINEEKIFLEDMIEFLDLSKGEKSAIWDMYKKEGLSIGLLDDLIAAYEKESAKLASTLSKIADQGIDGEKRFERFDAKIEKEEDILLAKLMQEDKEKIEEDEKALKLTVQKTKDQQKALKKQFEEKFKMLRKEMESELYQRVKNKVENS